jgi:hypothetical protein
MAINKNKIQHSPSNFARGVKKVYNICLVLSQGLTNKLTIENSALYFGQYPKLTLISCSQTQVDQPNTKALEDFIHDLKQAGYDLMHIISLQGSGRLHF